MKFPAVSIAIMCGLLLLAGCGRGLVSLGTEPPGFATDREFPMCLADRGVIDQKMLHVVPLSDPILPAKIDFIKIDAEIVAALYDRPLSRVAYDKTKPTLFVDNHDSALSGYLDCLLGPANDNNENAKLLRGHILLTLMTQYGAELVRASRSDRQPAQALRVISHIREAELLLVGGEKALVPTPATAAKPAAVEEAKPLPVARAKPPAVPAAPAATAAMDQLDQFWYAARITSILQVAIDVEGVFAQRSLDLASNLASVLGGGAAAVGQVKTLIKQAGDGLQLTQRSRVYGIAFIADSRKSLETIDATSGRSDDALVKAQWGLWSARLDAACADLAGLAKLSDPSCRPTADAVTKLRGNMGGASPISDSLPAKAAAGG